MTSVKGVDKTDARKQLDVIQGKGPKVNLGELSRPELYEFLRETLRGIDLREIRGFKPIKECLPFRSNTSCFSSGINHLVISNDTAFRSDGFDVEVTMDTQVMRLLCRMEGRLNVKTSYRRMETGEETEDAEVARSWDKQAYTYRGEETLFMVKRPRNHTGVVENMVLVEYEYQKVPLKDQHKITEIKVRPLPFDQLDKEFGGSVGCLAYHMLRNLADAQRRTAEDLRGQFERMSKEAVDLDRLCGGLAYPVV